MKKSVVEIYALLICLIALIWGTVSLAVGAYDCIRISAPHLTIGTWEYSKYLTNEKYIQSFYSNKESSIKPSEEEITKKRIDGMQVILNEEKREGLQSLIRNLIAIFLNSIVFFVHWRIAKRNRAFFSDTK